MIMTPDTGAPDSGRRFRIWRRLFRTVEGRILGLGVALTAAGLVAMGLVALWSPELARGIGGMAFANLVFGRAVSLSVGYAAEHSHAVVIAVNMVCETALVLLFYPLFVFSLNRLVVFPTIQGFLDRTHRAAERHEHKVRRYGVIGLFLFVWFPFWMTGPVVGSAIGYLIGLGAFATLAAVLFGTFVAILGWAYLIHGLHAKLSALAPWAPVLLIGVIAAAVLAGYWLNRRRS
jgi:uncharacterized membrane protein